MKQEATACSNQHHWQVQLPPEEKHAENIKQLANTITIVLHIMQIVLHIPITNIKNLSQITKFWEYS